MKKLIPVIFAFACFSCTKTTTPAVWTVTSPDGQLAIDVSLDSGRLYYNVNLIDAQQPTVVLERSPLGIVRDDQAFDQELVFISADSVKKIDETYTLAVGKRLTNHNLANAQILHFKNKNGAVVDLQLRSYNDGVAFRYVFPESGDTILRKVLKETTGFKLPIGGKAWIQPYDSITTYKPAYELFYDAAHPIGKTSPYSNGWAFPALFEANGVWTLITESNLNKSYVASHLQPEAPDGLYTLRLPEENEALGLGTNTSTYSSHLETPWRVIVVGRSLARIIESNLVNDVADPAQGDFSWVKPGRASWSWWSDHASSTDFGKLKTFVDLAANMGWEYSLVDANWNVMKGGTLEQLVAYAKQKNIGVLVWYNSGGAHNEVTEQPRNIMNDATARKAEFEKLEALGVKGVKVDFFQSDKQFIIQLYLDILRDAAEHHIMVDFHGCTIPRGWQRTWPNLVSMESVKGAESYSFAKDYPENAPSQNTILPFTRNVIGSMDYTPVNFSNQTYPHLTSYAHELALSVVFESGILHFADNVASFQNLPPDPKDFVKSVPAAWDETKYVSGYPGKDVVIARRKDNTWYVGGINGEEDSKSITIDFTFLPSGTYKATFISDGKSGKQFSTVEKEITNQSKEEITTLPYGGFAIKLYPEN